MLLELLLRCCPWAAWDSGGSGRQKKPNRHQQGNNNFLHNPTSQQHAGIGHGGCLRYMCVGCTVMQNYSAVSNLVCWRLLEEGRSYPLTVRDNIASEAASCSWPLCMNTCRYAAQFAHSSAQALEEANRCTLKHRMPACGCLSECLHTRNPPYACMPAAHIVSCLW